MTSSITPSAGEDRGACRHGGQPDGDRGRLVQPADRARRSCPSPLDQSRSVGVGLAESQLRLSQVASSDSARSRPTNPSILGRNWSATSCRRCSVGACSCPCSHKSSPSNGPRYKRLGRNAGSRPCNHANWHPARWVSGTSGSPRTTLITAGTGVAGRPRPALASDSAALIKAVVKASGLATSRGWDAATTTTPSPGSASGQVDHLSASAANSAPPCPE